MQFTKPNRHASSLPRIVTVMTIMLSTASMSFSQTVATKPTAENPPVDIIKRLDYREASPTALDAMVALTTSVKKSGLEPDLINLVFLRASQINGCDFCIDMHINDAKTAKMDERKLDSLPEWRKAAVYTDREKAAFGWTEAVTLVSQTHVPDDIYEIARKQFSEKELVDLTTAIVAINGWNRLNIAFRTPITCDVSDIPTVATKPATMKKPQVSVKILSQDKYEGKVDGKETTVTVVELTLDPLAGGTPHRHPGPVNGYILEGTYEFQVEGGPVRTLKAGDTFFEPAMILHKVSRNPDKVKRARVLATMVHPSDVESLTIRDPSDEQ